jgi:WD40 repeat protein
MYVINTGSTHPITHVIFHPNGSTFAVAQPNYGVTLLDRMSGHVVRTIPVPRVSDYSSILFVANGARLVVSSARGITICDTATGKTLLQRGKDILAGAVLAERDSVLIAATPTGLRELQIQEHPAGSLLCESFRALQSKATVIALSPCGRWGFGVYGRVKPSLLDIGTGRVVMAVDHPYRADLALASERPTVTFATNGKRFAVCDGNDVRVYDSPSSVPDDDDEPDPSLVQRADTIPTAPKPRALLESNFRLMPTGSVPSKKRWRPQVAFTPDARGLLIRRPRNRVQLLDVVTSAHIGEWSWRIDGVTYLGVAPDGLTAVAGARFGHVIVWDLE